MTMDTTPATSTGNGLRSVVVFMDAQTIRAAAWSNDRPLKRRLLRYDRTQMTEPAEYFFDGWCLKRSSGELTRAGETQRLAQQPLKMLLELLEHPGEVVTRERLQAVLWPKGVVEFDNSLNAVVRKLRVVLGDDSDAPRYIETLPRIGYRFIGKLGAPAVP